MLFIYCAEMRNLWNCKQTIKCQKCRDIELCSSAGSSGCCCVLCLLPVWWTMWTPRSEIVNSMLAMHNTRLYIQNRSAETRRRQHRQPSREGNERGVVVVRVIWGLLQETLTLTWLSELLLLLLPLLLLAPPCCNTCSLCRVVSLPTLRMNNVRLKSLTIHHTHPHTDTRALTHAHSTIAACVCVAVCGENQSHLLISQNLLHTLGRASASIFNHDVIRRKLWFMAQQNWLYNISASLSLLSLPFSLSLQRTSISKRQRQ